MDEKFAWALLYLNLHNQNAVVSNFPNRMKIKSSNELYDKLASTFGQSKTSLLYFKFHTQVKNKKPQNWYTLHQNHISTLE